MLLDKNLYHFYHAFADGKNSMIAIEEHLDNLITSNLSKNLEKFCVGIVGSEENRAKVKQALVAKINEIPLEIIAEADEGFEQITLEKMWNFSKNHEGYYFYAHTKSAANAHRFNECWMRTMEHYTLLNWIEAISQLKTNDAVGCFWITYKDRPNLSHWNDVKPHTNSFFAGNYWWATNETIRELPAPDNTNRYMAEQWLGNKLDLKVKELKSGTSKEIVSLNCGKSLMSCDCRRRKYLKRARNISFYLSLLMGVFWIFKTVIR
jgi:hypothetical protein